MQRVIFSPLSIADVLLVRTPRHADARGWFSETHRADQFTERGLPAFIQDNEVMSFAAGTVRGLHFQRGPFAQAKLVRCLTGAIHDVAVDIRAGSQTFGRHVAIRLDAATGDQVFIPAGFAHGYCTLTPEALVAYKVSAPYAPAHEGGVLWNDPALGIAWPVTAGKAVLSERDRQLPTFTGASL